jgi:hypothetical protein
MILLLIFVRRHKNDIPTAAAATKKGGGSIYVTKKDAWNLNHVLLLPNRSIHWCIIIESFIQHMTKPRTSCSNVDLLRAFCYDAIEFDTALHHDFYY